MKKEKLSFNELIHDPYYRDRDFIEFIDFKAFMGDVFPPYFFEEKNKLEYIEFCYYKRLNKNYLKFTRTKRYKTFDRFYNKARHKYKWDDSSTESFCDLDLKKIKHKKKLYSKKEVDFRLGGLSCSYYRMSRILESLRIEEFDKKKIKEVREMETEKNTESCASPYEPVCSITGLYNCKCWECNYDRANPRVRHQMLERRIMFHF